MPNRHHPTITGIVKFLPCPKIEMDFSIPV